ncbi:hypothetical protein [Methylophaga sp. OBS4]|uniref:hypothetical protein n=1 Tax=Methylophaga sp. OBS4 TaxID=2991935 RepID=UPI00224EAF49|nr:hypothetical protein [Methylophaga sp. OBS4]MCX4187668.1 hypothetical protein [Methylophaga sp. OBS4]
MEARWRVMAWSPGVYFCGGGGLMVAVDPLKEMVHGANVALDANVLTTEQVFSVFYEFPPAREYQLNLQFGWLGKPCIQV